MEHRDLIKWGYFFDGCESYGNKLTDDDTILYQIRMIECANVSPMFQDVVAKSVWAKVQQWKAKQR